MKTIDAIEREAKQAREKSTGACELLHDVKYELGRTKEAIQTNGNWIFVLIIGLIVSCVMSGASIYKTDKLREKLDGAVQRENERASGAGSKDSSGNREVPKIP